MLALNDIVCLWVPGPAGPAGPARSRGARLRKPWAWGLVAVPGALWRGLGPRIQSYRAVNQLANPCQLQLGESTLQDGPTPMKTLVSDSLALPKWTQIVVHEGQQKDLRRGWCRGGSRYVEEQGDSFHGK